MIAIVTSLIGNIVYNSVKWMTIASLLIATYFISRVVYNIFFHPLRKFPGPLANRASIFPRIYHLLNGDLPYHIKDVHSKYGPVVRIAPNELAFTDPQAWKDIYTRKTNGQYEFPHDMDFYNVEKVHPAAIISSTREDHDRVRKILNPGFSERAMRAQEPVIGRYVDLLMKRLRENCVDGSGRPRAVNMRDWIAYTTFDIIGQLAFGSDFGCLEDSTYHPWIRLIIDNLKDIAKVQALQALGLLSAAITIMKTFKVGDKARRMHNDLTSTKTKQRVEMGVGRDDFLDGLIKSGMGFEELQLNAGLLIIAGSETTATLLTGAVFLLTTHPEVLEKLALEVRSQFRDEFEITLTSVNRLNYMLAVINESFRCYPAVASGAQRIVPSGGAEVAGHTIPESTVVAVWQWAVYHDPEMFTDPYRFDPERFAQPGVGKYANDRLDAVNPFLIGPRNCIGQNLAYAEMRLILARLIWGFDMTISDESRGWLRDQEHYLLWQKPVLDVYLRPVER
ncbi:cytochrome P450 [Xylogone sp. PMI_703]|nr:cytochrome P450 [Xylogone sp. PMI_703]